MSSRRSRRSRSSVRLISYQTAPDTNPGAGPPRASRTAGPRRLRAVPPADGAGGTEVDLNAVAFVIARAFAEVLAGVRPLHHVAGRATPDVYDRLATALPAITTRTGVARTVRVAAPRVQEPAPGVAEVCAVAFLGTRAQALALRLERFRGRWRCSAVETTISPRWVLDHVRGKSA